MKHLIDIKIRDGELHITVDVYENITMVLGNTGVGKSYFVDTLSKLADGGYLKDVVTFNYKNKSKINLIKKLRGKIIIIDNADILLSDSLRKYIYLDKNNYYLIVGRNNRYLHTSALNLAELKFTSSKLSLTYPFLEDAIYFWGD